MVCAWSLSNNLDSGVRKDTQQQRPISLCLSSSSGTKYRVLTQDSAAEGGIEYSYIELFNANCI